MTATRTYLAKLEACGWFEGLPAALVKRQRQALRRKDASWKALVVTWLDAECIYQEGDYTAVLRELARDSAGLFRPRAVEERWGKDGARLALRLGDARAEATLSVDTDWLDLRVFALVNRALRGTGTSARVLRFDPLGGGQELALTLTTQAAFDRAKREGLVPGPRLDEQERRAATAAHEAATRERLGGISAVALSPCGERVAVADHGPDGGRLWLLSTDGRRLARVPRRELAECMAFTPDGRALLVWTRHGLVVRDPTTLAEREAVKVGRKYPVLETLADDGRLFGKSAEGVCAWPPTLGRPTTIPLRGGATGVARSADGRVLAAGVGSAGVALFALPRKERLRTLRPGCWAQLLAVSPAGELVAVLGEPADGGTKGALRLLDSATGEEVRAFAYELRAQTRPSQLAFTPDGAALVTWYAGGDLTAYDVASGRRRRSFPVGTAAPSFARARPLVVTSAPDGRRVEVFDVALGRRVAELTGEP